MTALVVAVADNGVIGGQNHLLWHLPLDLKHFRQLTLNHPIIMGRRTYDSIGRALPKRRNLVVTRQANWQAEGCEKAASVLQALEMAHTTDQDIFIVGGGEIYQQALPAADTVYLTEVHHHFEGDVIFPELYPGEWREEARQRHEPDEQHAYAFSFVTLRRR